MHTEGLLAPATEAAAREEYAAAEHAAGVVVREIIRSLSVADDAAEPDDAVLQTATEALFASLLEVKVGTRAEFDDYTEEHDRGVEVLGSEHVSGVAWHDAAALDRVIAATFENEPAAAVDALRRQTFAKCYREVI
ncbi:MAG: DUF5809 family protein [Salinirussus sp.]